MFSKSFIMLAGVCLLHGYAWAQADTASYNPHSGLTQKGLFDSDKVINITLKGNTRDLLNDRVGEPKYFPLTLSCRGEDSSEISIPVNVKTRGHFRRIKTNCFYPPLLIQFPSGDSISFPLFPKKAKLKLVMPCKGDEYVVREWLVYKIYNLVTDASFRARLVKVTLENDKNNKASSPFFGILLEEEQAMAKRNGAVPVNHKLSPEQTEHAAFLKMSTFEYLVGNTDWSVQYLQNIKLIAKDSVSKSTAVPYDFDHAGIVEAPYALPAEELRMRSIRERRYRGFCIYNMQFFDSTIVCFNRLKEDIYKLYSSCTLLKAGYIKSTLRYFDDFYKTINTPRLLEKEFSYPCDPSGTGNVVLKGLKDD
jgi:hypothetical protein